jgi:UTP--glucose-1-phosphate uridylyltransferase
MVLAAVEKMRAEGLAESAIDTFADYARRLAAGEEGVLAEDELEPVGDLPRAEDLTEDCPPDVIDRAVVLKLNGGLGTSMGLTGPKSLLEVKDGLTFLDLTVRQVLAARERFGARLPLVLMHSFATREQSLAALERYPELKADVPLDFVQSKVPKLRADDLSPVEWQADPELEWAPPGHGDLYTSLLSSGALERLLDGGYEYAFVANIDNLGAVLDPRILNWFASEELPFLMEVAVRTPADRKGGHLARRHGGGLVLREIAQTREQDLDAFQDTTRHRFFNSNTIWLNLRTLAEVLDARGGVLGLPMIVNRKTVDPTDATSPAVIQLEAAMGAAIDVFEGASAIEIPRTRFAPVKTTNDLLLLRSDSYVLTGDSRVELAPERDGQPPFIDLDPGHYKLVADFEQHFPAGPPSLIECERLVVKGDVSFGGGVTVRGSVTVNGPARIEDGATLEG